MTRWEQLAETLRDAITRGDHPPGSAIPKERELMAQHQVSRATVRQAVEQLATEGLVQKVRRRGTIVREHPPRTRIARSRKVYRDDIGYYFDATAQSWRALSPPDIAWGSCPYDVAHILGVAAGDRVLIRSRVIGDPATGEAHQLATSYLPADLARGTVLEEADTGPGGIYDRLEEMGHTPLQWTEAISARMPSPTEARELKLSSGTPVLRIVRVTTGPAGKVLEVNDTRLDAKSYEVAYPITRDRSAKGR